MTLTTNFIISDPYALPKEVFDYCQEIVGTVNPQWKHEQPDQEHNWFKNSRFRNLPFQGFSAILDVEYGADGPLNKYEDSNEPDGFIKISFDTAYGYRGHNGEGCDQLHASYIRKLGKWCEEKGWKYAWQNEYTGEWFNDWKLADNLST